MKRYNFLLFNILKKKKLCKFSILFFVILIVLFLSSLIVSDVLNNEYNNLKQKYISSSYIVASSEKKYNFIKNDLNKISFIKQYYPLMYFNNNHFSFVYFDENLINVIEGNYIKNKYEIMVSQNSKIKLNDTINVNINNTLYELEVVGIYKDDNRLSSNINIYNPIICSYSFMEEIIDFELVDTVVIQIYDYTYLSNCIDELQQNSYFDIHTDPSYNLILDRYSSLCHNINIFSNVIMIFVIIFIIILNSIIIYDNKNDIAIMKSIGYSDIHITFIMMFYSLILLMLSVLPSILILFIMSFVFNELSLNIYIFIKGIISFMTVIFLVNLVLLFVIRKVSIIKLIRN